MKRILSGIALTLYVSGLHAAVIGLNFTGNAGTAGELLSSDTAGLVGDEAGHSLGNTMTSNWNNLDGSSSTNIGNLLHSGGAVADGVAVSWSAQGVFSLGDTTLGSNSTANTTMMKGYLDSYGTATTITVQGLEAASGSYSVVVFYDGNNGDFFRRANFTIGGTTITGEDSEGVDFNDNDGNNKDGLFQIPVEGGSGNQSWPFSPNNSEGNTIVFTGLTSSSFTLTATPTATDPDDPDNLYRAAINGIQIIGVVPEPATISLVGFIGLLILTSRRFS